MSDILTDYREWRDKQPDRIGTHSDRCHMWERHERCMIHRLAAALAAEMAQPTLTDDEREAIEDARMCMKAFSEQQWPNDRTAAELRHHRKTLRGLLKRLT